ncbi:MULTISPECIES: hypothetical protein [Priestia]|jgi:hypothetical protein|nr:MULTISPECIES: hypothetical protein [Priestia]MED4027536.1 hypothetical protein [Priestia megaterium]MED4139872.1 hypothetical protein [Priestia megaterium]
MSNATGGSKKNQPNDANHVSAETKAHQKRLTEQNKQEHQAEERK